MMYSYSTIQWLFFFYFYCFVGWCFETAYVSYKKKRFVNRGFMRGPFLPLYGTGALMMLLVSMPFQKYFVLVYVAGCIGATVLEYVTGVVMEALFKVRYWDYSGERFNFQGHICLKSSLTWGFLTILMTEFVHRPVERFVLAIPTGILTPITLLLTAIICADFALAFKAAMDLRDVLIGMEKAREELMHIRKRLDVIIALTDEEITENIEPRIEELKDSIENRLERIKALAQTRHNDYLESRKDEILELKVKFARNMEDRERLESLKDFFQRNLILSHPSMSSGRFKEALEELKQRTEEKYREKKYKKKENKTGNTRKEE